MTVLKHQNFKIRIYNLIIQNVQVEFMLFKMKLLNINNKFWKINITKVEFLCNNLNY